ncbi:hypothetical protein CDAR_78471 [Caerostris darwini]|uniref:Uncharacterized protein n=1 Tax=Caerostris darwini TaxID=1538125 RepID=A0AAV4Q8C1_9ARAC|nr:hypothetical protein CDAR_78471 [Caerostris darwini]
MLRAQEICIHLHRGNSLLNNAAVVFMWLSGIKEYSSPEYTMQRTGNLGCSTFVVRRFLITCSKSRSSEILLVLDKLSLRTRIVNSGLKLNLKLHRYRFLVSVVTGNRDGLSVI